MNEPRITLSIVSHGQRDIACELLGDLNHNVRTPLRAILTENIPEDSHLPLPSCAFPLEVVHNDQPRGFGANHNAAFARCATELFCVLNPDIRIASDPFGALVEGVHKPTLAAIAPSVVDPCGHSEDHARAFPTIWEIAGKAIGMSGSKVMAAGTGIYYPDWIAGMFMLFRSTSFSQVGGFDQSYFLYYEDVDICARLRESGMRVGVLPAVNVVHHAQRSSHSDWRYSLQHGRSFVRYVARWPSLALGLSRFATQGNSI